MTTFPSSHPVRFLMAVVAAFAISFGLASVAAMTGMLPAAKVDTAPPVFLDSLADHLHAASVIAARSAAAQYAPLDRQSALVPQQPGQNMGDVVQVAATDTPVRPREPSI